MATQEPIHATPNERLDVESVDLASVTESLRRRFGAELLQDELPGRTMIRDAVVEQLGCSMLEAESIVDTMVLRGFVRVAHGAEGLPLWKIG